MQCDAKWDDGRTTMPNYRKYPEKFETVFPRDQILKVNFGSPEEISNYLIRQALAIGFFEGELYERKTVIKDGCTSYTFSCSRKSCDSFLEYRRSRGVLCLEKFANRHSHKLRLTPKKAKTQEIKQYLMDLPAEDNMEQQLENVKNQFNLSLQQAKYLKSKLFWRFDNDDQLLEKLTQRNVTFRRDADRGLLLLCSDSMKRNYERYGDLLCFDITYKLLKKKKGQARHIGVGFFVGQDENTRITLFAMCTIATETTDNFKRLFAFFFECMGGHVPQTILTDDQKAMVSALEDLKIEQGYQYSHLLDWFHKMEGLKRRIRREQHKEALYPLFCKAMKEPSRQIYADIIREIAHFLKREETMVDFLREQEKYCLCQVACSFFGFGVSSTRAESMNNLIKRSVAHQTNLGKLVFFVLRVEKRLINNMKLLCLTNSQLLVNIKDPELLLLSSLMEHLAYDQIRKYYEVSMEESLTKLADPLAVEVPYSKYDRPYLFRVRYCLWKECWVCECNAIYKTGMPCSHLVKVVRHFGGCTGYYINERWLHCKEDPERVKISRPPIAKNRRRI